jgi:hypothetical protein
MLVRLGYTEGDGKEKRSITGYGEAGIFDAGQARRSGPRTGADAGQAQGDRQESGGGPLGEEGKMNQNGRKDRLDHIEELLEMAAAQTAENAKQIAKNAKQIAQSRQEHDREMRQIRALFKDMIRRIAV